MERLSPEALRILAGRFRLLANPTRLQILNLLCSREMSVHELMTTTGQKQANLSKQLSLLQTAGFLRRRVSGVHAYYSVTTRTLGRLCEVMEEILRLTEFTNVAE